MSFKSFAVTLVVVSQVVQQPFVRIQWSQTDFLIMDSCGDVCLKAACEEVLCSYGAKGRYPPTDVGILVRMQDGVCLYSNVQPRTAPGYLRLLF